MPRSAEDIMQECANLLRGLGYSFVMAAMRYEPDDVMHTTTKAYLEPESKDGVSTDCKLLNLQREIIMGWHNDRYSSKLVLIEEDQLG